MKITRMCLLTVALAVAGAARAASPAPPQAEYSADSVLETAETWMKGRVYFTPTRERREMVMDGDDAPSTIKLANNQG